MRPILFYIPLPSFPSAAWYLLFVIAFVALGFGLAWLGKTQKWRWLNEWSFIIAAVAVFAVAELVAKYSGIPGTKIVYKPIYGYGTMLGLSFILGWYLMLFVAKRVNFPVGHMNSLLIIAVVASLLGARLFHVISNPYDWKNFFAFQRGGLVAYGGFIFALGATAIYLRIKKIDIWRAFDVFTPSIAMGLGFTRIGCFLRGCCYGIRTKSFLGVSFPKESLVWQQHTNRGYATNGDWSVPVFPTQLFESALGFALMALALYLLLKKKTKTRGAVFLLIASLYAVGRFLLEFIRDDLGRAFYFGGALSESQLYGIFVLIFAAAAWAYLRKHPEPAFAFKQESQRKKSIKKVKPTKKKK